MLAGRTWRYAPSLVGLLCAAATLSAQQFPASSARLTGFLEVVWEDPPAGSEAPPRILFALVEDGGTRTELRIGDAVLQQAGGLLALRNERVTVTLEPAPLGVAMQPDTPPNVTAIARVTAHAPTMEPAKPAPVTGNKKWITLLCRYADLTGYTPVAASIYRDGFAETYPGLGLYWQENSLGLLNITGSQVLDWVNLPSPESTYTHDSTKARDDCIAAAGAGVDFRPFFGINLVFNGGIGGASGFGGTSYLTLNGEFRAWGTTWIAALQPDYMNNWLFAHEMGHAFGLPHSSGPYGQLYDTIFDVMGGVGGIKCQVMVMPFGCTLPHTISYHKDLLGWLPASRIFTATAWQQSVMLEPLSSPAAQPGTYQMLVLQIPGSTGFFTIERRTQEGYDRASLANGVIIHEVDPTRAVPAQVVDGDGVPPPDDAGGNWTTGEVFLHAPSGVRVTINSTATRLATIAFKVPLTFTDDPLSAGVTPIRAVHLVELRQRIGELRTRYGLASVAWTDSVIAPAITSAKAVHVTELRLALTDVYASAGQPAPAFSPIVTQVTTISAAHINELRSAILAVW